MRSDWFLVGVLVLLGAGIGAEEADDGPQVASAPVRREALDARAAAAMADGRRAELAGDYHAALDAYNRARILSADTASVRRSINRVRQILGWEPLPDRDQAGLDDVRQQLAHTEIRVALKRAEMDAGQGRFASARELAGRARALLRRHPLDRQQQRLEAVAAFIDRLEQQVAQQRTEAQRAALLERQEYEVRAMHARLEQEQSIFETKLGEIIETAQRAHYELALARARKLVSEYPQEDRATALFNRLLERVHEQRELTFEQRNAELKQEISERIRRSLIPSGFDGEPHFPDDWLDRADRRSDIFGQEIALPAWRDRVLNSLMSRVSVNYREITAVEAIDNLARRTGVNIVIGNEIRSAAPVSIDFTARDIRIDRLLNWLTRQAGTKWSLRNEAVYVGDDAGEEAMFRVYDVVGLINRPPDLPGLELDQALGGEGGGVDMGAFNPNTETDLELIAPEDLVDMIQRTVAPDLWENDGFGIGIRNNMLLVRAPAHVQLLIEEFLGSMRTSNNQLVHLAVNWLEIRDDFIEEIGWDWTDEDSVLSNAPVDAGYEQAYREYSNQLETQHLLPESAVNTGALFGQGLNLQHVYLGMADVSAVFTAVSKKLKVRRVSGIDMTTVNGVQGNAFFGRQLAYIASYSIAGDDNYEPEVEMLSVGQSLDVKPYISADRKYVTLNIRPFLVTVDFETETITTVRETNGLLFNSDYPIQLPNTQVFTAGTSVIIPDGGTVLVGGFGSFTDQHSKAQVPFLGHLPFLGRLFSKRGRYSERWRLYLSLSAKIILYDEEEAMQ